jgi:hypothetical protein
MTCYRDGAFAIVTVGIILSGWQHYARHIAYYLPSIISVSIACFQTAGETVQSSFKCGCVKKDVFWTLTDKSLVNMMNIEHNMILQ